MKENDPADTVVGKIAYIDEDIGQTHTITMTDTDGGQFKLSADGTEILKAKSTDYETKAVHSVTIKVTDNGSPPMSVSMGIHVQQSMGIPLKVGYRGVCNRECSFLVAKEMIQPATFRLLHSLRDAKNRC